MALRVEVDWAEGVPADPGVQRPEIDELLERAAVTALRAHDVTEAELSVALVDDRTITDLNRRFLGHEGPTDVIAFSLYEEGETPVGDVYIAYAQAVQQAETLGVSLREELARLAIHGTLHVLGHDHPDGAEREESELWHVQERLLRELTGM